MTRVLEEHRRNVVAALGAFGAGSATATTAALPHADAFDAGIGRVGGFFTAVIPHRGAGPEALEDARSFARRQGTALLLWTAGSADALMAHECWLAGLDRVGAMSGMVLDHTCADATVETEVVDEGNAQDYLDLQRAQLGAAAQHVARPEVLLRKGVRARIARVDSALAACGLVVTTGSTAGLYWSGPLSRIDIAVWVGPSRGGCAATRSTRARDRWSCRPAARVRRYTDDSASAPSPSSSATSSPQRQAALANIGEDPAYGALVSPLPARRDRSLGAYAVLSPGRDVRG